VVRSATARREGEVLVRTDLRVQTPVHLELLGELMSAGDLLAVEVLVLGGFVEALDDAFAQGA
jgi:hypothetical protein